MSRRNDPSTGAPAAPGDARREPVVETGPEPSWEIFLDEETGMPTLALRPALPFPVEALQIRSGSGSDPGGRVLEISGGGRRLVLPIEDLDAGLLEDISAMRQIRIMEFEPDMEIHNRDTLIDGVSVG